MIGIIEKIDALKVAKVAFNIGVGRITKWNRLFFCYKIFKKRKRYNKKRWYNCKDLFRTIYKGK